MARTGRPRTAVLERFVARVEFGGACWEWHGVKNNRGYGLFKMGGRCTPTAAHRAAYMLLVGPIPDGMQLDHLCRNRVCVNPDHLEPVTPHENRRRSMECDSCRAARAAA